MRQVDFGFVPQNGFTGAWLKDIYRTHLVGSRAVGKDGVRPKAFAANLDAECELIASKVNNGTYQLTPYREKLIARGAMRYPRQISVPTVRDRLALRAALSFLKFHFPDAQPRPPHLYIKDIKSKLAAAREHSSFLRMDIRDFYPSLRHDLLEERLSASAVPNPVISLIMRALRTNTGSKHQRAPSVGVPQGLSISNALASIYMIDLDQKWSERSFYRRYVDDLLIIDASEKVANLYQQLWSDLSDIGLTSHPMGTPGKTETKRLPEGIEYLGYKISLSEISVRKSSLDRMFSNISKVITCFKYRDDIQRHLFRLNLKITGCLINGSRRGWLMFFSQTENVSQISYLDAWLKLQLKNVNIPVEGVKSFKRSYYEIRYSIKTTRYIPNFDEYDIDQKREVINILSRRAPSEIAAMNFEAVEIEFNRLIGREVAELERDLVDAFS